ncbi:type II toxin-antitoxin system HicB family antitoxin [Neisseria sp. ZJ106]|uniref:Type II toxin-antitoxin system HicB family antitoxin n=1 Tax=Neisseria lisongii TaxID=2912188 RepID=A0ABY7RLU6_9NEIS|nr:type II toxin-antitoxin system HicB family antitoxin [Neisseria lisongii]MCF7521693.1 type II toxin-antitoxin system HicB family antitoxin [Neisseria lisongii]WCL72221.1 type II toxin-antitoxin system HicB family antitoxin [Neisseria lisongii]
MLYPAQFTPDEKGGYIVTFRDIPEAITQGDDLVETRMMAEDALQCAMDFYFEHHRRIPLPSKLQKGEEWVALPENMVLKVLSFNEQLVE